MNYIVSVFWGIFLQIVSVLCQNDTNSNTTVSANDNGNGAHSVIFTGVVIVTATVLARIVS